MADTAGLLNMCTGSVHNPYTGGTVCFSLEETESNLHDPMSLIAPKTRDVGIFTLDEDEEWKAPLNIIPIRTTEFDDSTPRDDPTLLEIGDDHHDITETKT